MTNEGLLPRARKRRVALAAALASGLTWVAPAALADTYDNGGFESFAYGDPVGQAGWTANSVGAYDAANFDIDVVDPSAVWGTQLGTHALRLSNAVTSSGFGNQLQTPSLANAAGETTALAGTTSGGARQSRLAGSFKFGSATQSFKPGRAFGFAPDRGDGARMSSFRVVDEAGGFRLDLTTVDSSTGDFVATTIASGLSHTALHTIQFSLDFVEGENNDVLWVSVDNSTCTSLAQSGSWEQYHRHFAGNPTPVTFTADSLLFRLSGAAQPALLGGGVVIDDMQLSSSTVPAMPAPGVPTIAAAPTALATAQHVDVSHPAVTTNACQPITGYTATLTPNGGGSPITLTSATPDFDFDAVPIGTYGVTLAATNSAGTSAPSAAAQVTVAAAATNTSDPVVDDGGDELAETGTSSVPLALVALGLMSLGFVMRRFATSRS